MGYFINAEIGYYEGDQLTLADIKVPQRPDITHAWSGTAWQPTVATSNGPILAQIAVLESSVSERRIREAVLNIDNGWLKSLNDQIAALRAQLAKSGG